MKTLLVILGPTAVGKTALAMDMAQRYASPIINADSRQLYAGMEIGTAAPTPEQRARVRHYFVGTLPLDAYYSAARYEADVMALTADLFRTHDTLVLAGGSMLYIDVVCRGIDDIPTITDETRTIMRQRLHAEGLDTLKAELRLLDPAYYARADLHNTQRIVHALEVCYQTGLPFSHFHTGQSKARPFRIVKIGLDRPRPELFQRIGDRVDDMLRQGLLDEARALLPPRHLNALNTVGYKEMFAVLDGTWTLPFAAERMKKNTRVYAKKQLTWFHRDTDITWFHPDDTAAIQAYIDKHIPT